MSHSDDVKFFACSVLAACALAGPASGGTGFGGLCPQLSIPLPVSAFQVSRPGSAPVLNFNVVNQVIRNACLASPALRKLKAPCQSCF